FDARLSFVKQLVIALSAALVVCFVVIAFLAGRMSAPIAPVIVPQPSPERGSKSEPVPVPLPVPDHAKQGSQSSQRADIDAYFTRIKSEQIMEGSDPNAYAQELMQGVMKGDPS